MLPASAVKQLHDLLRDRFRRSARAQAADARDRGHRGHDGKAMNSDQRSRRARSRWDAYLHSYFGGKHLLLMTLHVGHSAMSDLLPLYQGRQQQNQSPGKMQAGAPTFCASSAPTQSSAPAQTRGSQAPPRPDQLLRARHGYVLPPHGDSAQAPGRRPPPWATAESVNAAERQRQQRRQANKAQVQAMSYKAGTGAFEQEDDDDYEYLPLHDRQCATCLDLIEVYRAACILCGELCCGGCSTCDALTMEPRCRECPCHTGGIHGNSGFRGGKAGSGGGSQHGVSLEDSTVIRVITDFLVLKARVPPRLSLASSETVESIF